MDQFFDDVDTWVLLEFTTQLVIGLAADDQPAQGTFPSRRWSRLGCFRFELPPRRCRRPLAL